MHLSQWIIIVPDNVRNACARAHTHMHTLHIQRKMGGMEKEGKWGKEGEGSSGVTGGGVKEMDRGYTAVGR